MQVAESLWRHLRSRLPACAFVLYAHDLDRDTLVAVHAAGEDVTTLRGVEMPVGERLSGWVAATRQIVLNSDARLDLDERDRDASLLRSALAVPVEADGRVCGVLSFYAREANAFADAHQRLARAAARVTAQGGVPSLLHAHF